MTQEHIKENGSQLSDIVMVTTNECEKLQKEAECLTRKCRRKPMKNSISVNSNLEKQKTLKELKIDTNNNRGPPSIYRIKSSVKLSTEVIDIEEECFRAKSSVQLRHGVKRAKSSIDQLLSKVEAKHNKMEDISRTYNTITSTIANTKKIVQRKSSSDTLLDIYPHSVTSPSPSSENKDVKKALPVTARKVQSSSCKKTKGKPNKRTITTNERYSKLTSTQLQRRLVANARERSRVHALSNAFDSLRCTIPSYSTEQKLSKLTILRVAINYINALDQLLAPNASSLHSQQNFERYVDECTAVLQTEYGRSKTKNNE